MSRVRQDLSCVVAAGRGRGGAARPTHPGAPAPGPAGPPRARRVLLGAVVAMALLAGQAVPAGASPLSAPGSPTRTGTNTQMVMSGVGPGQGVTGFIAQAANPFDPVLDGYPASNPTTGFDPWDEGFAGIIHGQPTDGSGTLDLYCFDILTPTYNGIGYALGTWDAADVPNVGFVARILDNYYPFVPSEPAGLADADQQAAAVQAAVWFFSDRYVLSTADPLYGTVVGIVDAVLALGPVVQPGPPGLTLTPSTASGPDTGAVVGPFTVSSTTGSATVTATGAAMFSDAGATAPIANGSEVTTPASIWLRSTGPTSAVLQATANVGVPRNNVYLYDGNTPGTTAAQHLILASDSALTTTVSATAEFRAVTTLVVQKTIAGPAAGQQGQVTIHTVCDGVPLTPDFVIASGTPAGTSARTYAGLAVGSTCTVTETADGHTSTVLADVAGDGQQVVIPPTGGVTAALTDTYTFVPGSLTVTKTITGEGAGQQGEVVVHVACAGVDPGLTPDFVIAAGHPAGDVSRTYDDLPGNTGCTVTESDDGSNAVVSAVVTGGGPVTVPVAGAADIGVTDDYSLNPGSLVVTKTIAGAAAGSQGAVTIAVVCSDGVARPDFVVPAGTAAGTTSMTFGDIPADTVCTATESADGSTSTVAAEISGDNGTPVTIPAGATASAAITNTYTDTSGTLVVNKVITGNGAGLQGVVTVQAECDGTVLAPVLSIPAGGTSASTSYAGLVPGASCTVTETDDGGIAGRVSVATTIAPTQPVVIPASGSVEVDVTDTYTALVGSLTVTKNIVGPAAGQQGAVTIEVLCVGVPPGDTPPFVIPAGSTGSPSHTYGGLPDQATCLVVETVDGSSSTVSVTVSPTAQSATVVAGQTTSVAVTDAYEAVPGDILVDKDVAGPSAGQQGPITIAVTCGGGTLASVVVPAGAPAGPQMQFVDGIPAGSTCTVAETEDGATGTVDATVPGADRQTVTVPAGTVVPAVITDVFTDTPGTLTVMKTVGGAGAGAEGPIAILVDCGESADQFAFLLPAATPAGTVSRSFAGIPAGSTCTVTETATGATGSVAAAVSGSGQQVAVGPAASATVTLADTYTPTTRAVSLTTLPATGVTPALRDTGVLGVVALATGCLLVALGRGGPRRRRGRRLRV